MAPSPKVAAALTEAESLASSSGDGAPAYEAILTNIQTLSPPASRASDLDAIFDSFFLRGELGVVATRSVLDAFVRALSLSLHLDDDDNNNNNDQHDLPILVGTRALRSLAGPAYENLEQSSVSSPYAQATAQLIELLGRSYEAAGEFLLAAQTFARIPLDPSTRKISDDDRASVWVRIARNYLEVGDHVAADMYVNKLKSMMHTVSDKALVLHFRVSEARIHDAKREFLPAADKYHRVSFAPDVAEEDQLRTLAMAVNCAVLAPAGPQRSLTLARLYKDDRCAQLPDFAVLEKMFLDRLLSPDEVAAFAERLQPHQLALTADGSTVLEKAVIEHNLLGASKLYDNIRFDALGDLLGLGPDKAEETTARMIEQGRLVGRMDQLDGIVWFDDSCSSSSSSGEKSVAFGKEMRRWDANVESLAQDVENITNSLQKEFPALSRPFLVHVDD